jgi:hypothetical protein
MKKIILSITICLFTIQSFAQITVIAPGDKRIDKAKLKDFSNITMDYTRRGADARSRLIGKYEITQKYDNKTLEVITALNYENKSIPKLKHIVANADNFNPISLQFLNMYMILELNFSNKITGVEQASGSEVKTPFTEEMKDGYFDNNIIPYLLPALPLKEGFRAKLPVYNYFAKNQDDKFYNAIIIGVNSEVKYSHFTGNHNVWQVMVLDDDTKETTTYFIEKETGKLWEIFHKDSDGDYNVFTYNESDYNPLKNKFNKEETLKLVTNGKSIIKGQAFARDNNNKVYGVNLAKKQFAPKGTIIVLIPYTPYFEEWNNANQQKKNSLYTPPTLPLPKGAEKCIIETKVIDDEGHFEFSKLMPGKFLITTTFDFGHTAYNTTVVGYTDYFYNGYYNGSTEITNTESYGVTLDAKIKKVGEIKKDGETIEIKMKRSL